jgi:2-haloacid dehalogenase
VPSPGPSSRYSWIIFDADNTLFDFDRAEHGALERALDQFGVICDAEVRAGFTAISSRLWRAFEGGAITSARLRVARFEELLAGRAPAVDPDLVSETYLRELGGEAHLLPQAEEVVRRLVVSHRLLLATNGIADIQRRRFSAATIGDCFHDVVISDEIGVAKPHSGFFDEAFRRMGDPAREQVLLVGDSLTSDIAGGAAYGIDTCWFCPRDPPATPVCISTDAAAPSRAATSPAAPSSTTGDGPAPCMATDGPRPSRSAPDEPSPTYRIRDLRELLAIVALQ